MPVIKTFLLPDLGEGLTEAELLSWSVGIGDAVALNQIIAEVETAKAMVELPSPHAGTVVALHTADGTTVGVGTPLIDIEVPDDSTQAATPPPAEADSRDKRVPVLVGYGVAPETSRRRQPAAPMNRQSPARPLASPPVRFAARQRGIDLAGIVPTGARSEVTREDLDRASRARTDDLASSHDAPAGMATAAGEEVRTPIKGVRKHTADAMVRSAFTAPHASVFVDVDVSATMELLDELRASTHFAGIRLTPLTMVAKALVVALRTNPSLNSSWDDDTQEIITKKYVHLGIAAATPRGLVVPNIKNAHTLGLLDLAVALSELTATAKQGKTSPAALAGGTITITNVGVFGIDSGTPILNPGEAAILCLGSIRRRPWEHNDDIALRWLTTLSLSFDHRLVDGEQAAKFLATVAEILDDPLALIALS